MNFHAFYNLDNVGDVLLARLTTDSTFKHVRYNDLVVLKNIKDEVIGYNVFNASKYFSDLNCGLVKLSDKFVDVFNDLLNQNNLANIVVDLSDKFIVGKVIEINDHPDSDHLHVCVVDLGSETTQIVCGAPNVDINQTVVVATIGAIMPSGLIIKPSVLRRVESNGMICSAKELNLPNAPKERGILILDETRYKVGTSFF